MERDGEAPSYGVGAAPSSHTGGERLLYYCYCCSGCVLCCGQPIAMLRGHLVVGKI